MCYIINYIKNENLSHIQTDLRMIRNKVIQLIFDVMSYSFKKISLYGIFKNIRLIIPLRISSTANVIAGFNSVRMSRQFWFKNWFILSPSAVSPLNKFSRLIWSRDVSKSNWNFSVWMKFFPFFWITFGLYLTTKLALSKTRWALPSPWMGRTSTRPSILYFPWIVIFGTSAYTSYLLVFGSVPKPLNEKTINLFYSFRLQ